ncbi:esterase/lipase family protein, partial [Pseudomonas aeruginosa]
EIYKKTTWYGLVPEQNSQYIDMSDKKEGLRVGPRDNFEDLIDSIANFHGELSAVGYHSEPYAHYGADDSRHSWRDLIRKGDPS